MKNFIKIINTFLIVLIGVMSFGHVAFADYNATSTLTVSGNFTVPLGVTSLNISIVGGGGGGAGGAFTYGGGGGGSGAAISNASMSVVPGQVIPFIVGTGGAGGSSGSFAASGGNGSAGIASFFGALISANGGNGGIGATTGGGGGTGGTTGGVGGTDGTHGDTSFGERHYGGSGGTNPFSSGGTGGYGSAGTYSLPTAGTNGNGGGAGSGWALFAAGTDAGARGGDGVIIVSYYADLTAPVITITGSSTITIAAGSVYADLGATAIDNIDGDITAGIVTTGLPINTAATGTYPVVYTSTDSALNIASTTRTVIVTDQTAPVITSPVTQTFEATGATTTPALVLATAIDNVDPSPVITYNPASFGLGTTTVVWTATDSSGNFSTSSSLVVIKDTTAPSIVLNGTSTVSIMIGIPYIEVGANAIDLVDGTTTVVITGSVNTNLVGTYFVIYSSTDSSGNPASIFRTVNVTPDTISPVIVTPIDQTFEATGATTTPVLVAATSTDNFTINPVITYAPSSFVLGTSTVVWTATDGAGNFSTTTSLVTIIDTTAPSITLNGSSTINLFVGGSYVELGASSTDLVDGSVLVSATGTVDTSATGTYNVLYTATDSQSNTATSSRTVNVTVAPDLTAPVITILGSNPLTKTSSSTEIYVDAGATAFDNIDGTTTVNTIFNDVNLAATGTYSVVYSATDLSLNTATSSRTVNVVAPAPAVLTTIIISPVNPLVLVGTTTQFTATTLDQYGLPFASSVIWVSTNNIVGTIAPFTGLFSGLSAGTTTVTVFSGALSTSTTVTVGVAPSALASISISPLNPSVTLGATTTFVSTTLDQYSLPFATTTNWTSSDLSVGSIDAGGIFTASSTGTTTVTGTAGIFSTSTLVTVTNIIVPDTTAPTIPTISSISATGTIITSANISWTDSTDAGSGLKEYLFVFDGNVGTQVSTTTIGVATTSATTTSSAVMGTVYFHVAAIDNAGNISSSTSAGPFVISDSAVLYKNSTIGVTLYSLYSPTLAQSVVASTTGTTTITNSTLSTFWNVNNSTLTTTSIDDVNLDDVISTNSTFINSDVARCTVINSLVKNYFARDCSISFSVIDPSGMNQFISSTSTNSQIYVSDIFNSTVDHSYVSTSTINSSNISYSTSTDSTISTSTISNGSIIDFSDVSLSNISNSIITNSTVVNSTSTDSFITNSTTTDSVVSSSTLTNITASSSTITNSTIYDAILVGATIVNNIMSTGTITYNGTTTVISTSTPLTALINYAPVAGFTFATSTLQVTLTDSSTDVNEGTGFVDSWIYNWNFGDGATSTIATSSTNGSISHTYATSGSYIIGLVITDSYGATSSATTSVTVSAAVDLVAPVITILGSNPVTVVASSTYTDAGATANDNIDGNITGSIITTNPVDANTVGVYTVTYTVSDTALNSATATRTVNVVATADITDPVITILGLNPETVTIGGVYVDAGATSTDNVDGNITASIITAGLPVDTSATGTQTVTYTVTDGAGNSTSSVRVVNVIAVPVDTIPPVITMNGGTPITITIGSSYIDAGATAYDAVSGTTTVIEIFNNVNTSATGTYSIVYSSTDAALNSATTSRTINVIPTAADNIAPVITIVGGTPTTIVVGGTYTDAGATALDNIDGVVSVTTLSNDVNAGIVGSYTVAYSAIDVALNNSTAIRNVNVVAASTSDIISPAIIITGGTPITITVGGTYTDAGATAIDDVDGAISATTTANNVNTGAIGSYTVDYSATDLAGNTSTATRNVNVVAAPPDVIPPVITMNGGTPITIALNLVYTDLGATAFDNVDGTTTVNVVFNNVNTAATGTYTVTYSATDIAGNNATTSRTVNVILDGVAPAVTVLGANPMTIIKTIAYIEAGATAVDNIDATTTVVISGSVNINATGTYFMIYTATDSSLNSASSTRTVNVIEDNIAPVITITGSNPASLIVGGTYTDAGATALDNIDGVVTATTTSNNVNVNVVGAYSVVYSATDVAGNIATTSRVVNVNAVDAIPPVITILGLNPVTVLQSTVYTDAGATANDNVNGNVTGSIVTTNSVNTAVVGAYTVTYVVSDAQLNTSTSTRVVNVVAVPDVTPPVITILGSNPVSLFVGGTYTDAGATSTDNIDGNITSNITLVSTVNTLLAGSYSVTYTIVDGAGNSASSTRVVNVNTPTLSSIAVTTPANKLVYTVGNSLDITGLVVTGTYSDASTSTQTILLTNVTGFNSTVPVVGQVLTITVGIRTTTYTVNINAAPSSGGGGGSRSYAVGDINSDDKIDEYDFSLMMSQWGQMFGFLSADLNHDGKVDEYDFSLLMFNWR
jgi:hypothetical protein